MNSILVFIHRSIKTRIETFRSEKGNETYFHVFIHRSIKTRIETVDIEYFDRKKNSVFIHRSIKTRIETRKLKEVANGDKVFLYIDPLKQGLKLSCNN